MTNFFYLVYSGLSDIWDLFDSAWFMSLPLVFFVFDRVYHLFRRLFV